MFIYKVVSVLISGSVLSKPQSFSQSFASQILTDSGGRTISKSIYTDSSGSAPELLIGLVPPFSGDSNDIDSYESPEPIVIIKPPPYMKKTTSYPTQFTTTRTTSKVPTTTPRLTTTRAPATAARLLTTQAPTTQRLTTIRTTTPRTTVIPKTFSVRPPPQFVPRVSAKSSSEYKLNYDGLYRPKGNTGAYTHNSAGAYRHSNSGAYKPDDRGKYRGN